MKKGKFIALEGIDGSGKSSQIKRLAEKLDKKGYQYHMTCEPTKNPIGSLLRQILTGQFEADEKTIAALFLADRLDHIQNKEYGILQYLEKGYHVISDRYYFSSYAYHVPEAPQEWVIDINAQCAALLRPDLNIFIEMSPTASLKRIESRNEALEKYETLDRLSLIAKNYQQAIDLLHQEENIVKVNGEKSMEAVFDDIWRAVKYQIG